MSYVDICELKHFNTRLLNKIIIVILGSLSIALSAQVSVPLQPVPVTLQTFAVSLVSAIFGPIMGTQMVLLYLFEGIVGLPVFTNFSCGLMTLLEPTGGYLIGFIFAAWLTGYLLKKGETKNSVYVFLAVLSGHFLLFLLGYVRLAHFIGYKNAYLFGIAPFYTIEATKLLLLTLIISRLKWKHMLAY